MHGVEFPLFVYGTLERGYAAHARFCTAARDVVPARCHGRLLRHPEGYPALVVDVEITGERQQRSAWTYVAGALLARESLHPVCSARWDEPGGPTITPTGRRR